MRKLFCYCFLFLMVSCNSSVPKGVLAPSKMQTVLWDVMQADELTNYYAEKDSSLNILSKYAENYQKVFSIHGITKGNFVKSLDYYEAHPEKLKPILDSLQSFAERIQKADTLKKTSPKPDSIRVKKITVPI